jgi:hypothetical protein
VRLEFSQSTKKARWVHCHDSKGIPHCEYCWAEITAANPCEYDHYKEAHDGGDNSFENCRVACKKTCHKKKTAEFKTSCAKSERLKNTAKGANLRRPRPKIQSAGFRKWA